MFASMCLQSLRLTWKPGLRLNLFTQIKFEFRDMKASLYPPPPRGGGELPYKPIGDGPFFSVSIFSLNFRIGYKN